MSTPGNSINGVISTLISPFPVLQVPQAIDYTSKDFLGLVTSMLAYANAAMPNWNTNSEGDMGVMMCELMAYVGDILSYYGDRLTQEAYLPTATQRLSILNIARLLGYVPVNGAPATGTVVFQTDPAIPITVVPKGTQVQTALITGNVDAPVIYQTTADVSVPANGGTATIGVSQGISYVMTQIGTSDGTAAQQYSIPQPGVIDGTVQVFVQTVIGSAAWNFVHFLVDAGADDSVFGTFTDAAGLTWVQFGDNVNGMIPATGLSIWASYTIGAGSDGNQPAGTVGVLVNDIPGVFVPFLADGVTYNSSAMVGGADAESNDQIRANAPAAFRAQYRAVSAADFADLALNVPGVLMASAVANHNTSVGLYVLGPNYQPAGSSLSAAILSYFSGKTIAGVSLSVLSPALIPVDVGSGGSNVTIQIANNFSIGTVIQGVTQALNILLSPPNSQFGQLLTLSSIMGAIMAIPGVLWCTVPLFTRQDITQATTASIQFRQSEIPVPGNFYLLGQGGLGS